jgi:uncharacterized membrane protein
MKVLDLLTEAAAPMNFPKGFDPKYSICFEENFDNLFKKALKKAGIEFKYWTEWNGVYEFAFKTKDDYEAAKKVARTELPKEAMKDSWFSARRNTVNKPDKLISGS